MGSWAAFRRRWFAYLCAAILTVAFVGLRVWDPAPLQFLRLKTFDIYQRLHPRADEPLPVIIVDIDEDSLRPTDSGRGRGPASPSSSTG